MADPQHLRAIGLGGPHLAFILRRDDFQRCIHEMPGIAFGLLRALCARLQEADSKIGGLILLDVNNIYVSAVNHEFAALDYLNAIPVERVQQIHLAGHAASDGCLIDTHGACVSAEVWTLYRESCRRFGPKPTLIEWDTDLPSLDVLLIEATTASSIARHTFEAEHV